MTQELKTDARVGSRRQPATKDVPRAARSAFNPLHPSMELPPEQLLRLLSPDTWTPRTREVRQTGRGTPAPSQPTAQQNPMLPSPSQSKRPRIAPTVAAPSQPQPPRAHKRTPETPQPKVRRQPPPRASSPSPMRAERSYAATARAAHRKGRKSLLGPALGLGLLLGLGACAYLFLYRGVPIGTQTGSVPAGSAPAAKQRTGQTSDVPPAIRIAHAASGSGGEGRPGSTSAAPANGQGEAQAGSSLPSPATSLRTAEGQATLQAERLQLRAEAEKRFAERLAGREGHAPLESPANQTPGGR